MLSTSLDCFEKQRVKVCFKKELKSIVYGNGNGVIPGPFKIGKSYNLPFSAAVCLIKEGSAFIASGSLSIDGILADSSNFDLYFDRQKILDFIRSNVNVFWTEILGKNVCGHCGKTVRQTYKKGSPKYRGVRKGAFIESRCSCGKPYRKYFVHGQYPDWVIASVMQNFFQGKTLQQVWLSLKSESINRYLDFFYPLVGDCQFSLGEKEITPSKNTVKRLLSETSKRISKFNSFMILLMGGLDCKTLFIDDAFARNILPADFKKKLSERTRAGRGELESKRFYYIIVSVDRDSRFILNAYVARHRNKLNFMEALDQTLHALKKKPEIVMGDKLAAMSQATEIILPSNEVIHSFEDLEPWEKGERNLIERRIRDLRQTFIKRRKSHSFNVLEQLAATAMIGLNYLVPMPEVLENNTPAQRMGIPYPFDSEKGRKSQSSWNWRVFLIWMNWIWDHETEILTSGLR